MTAEDEALMSLPGDWNGQPTNWAAA